jgi:regulation of enolase protein 1 (concanavalin A-like superfamily)
MLRSGRTASAAYAFMLISGEKGLAFQYRTASGQMAAHTDGGASRAPVWLKLSRRGGAVTAYTRTDTTSWRFVGLVSIPFGGTVQAGLAVTSHSTGALATATFSNVSVRPVAAWTSADIGAVGVTGQFAADGSTVTVTGAGADIWDTADAFRFAWQPLSGDGEVVARVRSVQAIRSWSKAGVMIREATDAASPHALMLVSGGKGLAFQRRLTRGGLSVHTSGGTGTAPVWVRLTRRGNMFSAYTSTDGRTWQLVGSELIAMGRDVYAGLAVSSHSATARCTAVFESVAVR